MALGVAEAKKLGVFEVLVAVGALTIPTIAQYDELSHGEQIPLGGWAHGVDGSLNIRHPLARQALIRGPGIPEDVNTVAREKDKMLISFPQGHEMHRTYLVVPTDDKDRYSGHDGVTRFFADCALESLPGSEAWAHAELAEPLATFPCGDTWIHEPVRDGVALIGDAGGYNNFLIGQGLSLALRDATELADRLNAADWTHGALLAYGRRRAERLEKARLLAAMAVMSERGFRDDPPGRQRFKELAKDDDLAERVRAALFTGGHDTPLSDYQTLHKRYSDLEASLAA